MSSSPAGATPRRLLLNGVHMSASFAGLEGCVFATINIAAAVVPPATAHFANGMLYLFFSVGALVAPLIVQRIGAKRSLIAGMSFYCFFMAGYIVHTRPVLVLGASVGGFAGAVLWVAQGVYFTANAQVYDETASVARQRPLPQQATQPLQEQRQAQQRWSSNLWTQKATNSITTFAGIFAFTFQLVTTVAKPTAWILLTAYPRNIEVLFGAFTAVAVLCTISMVFVAPMGATDQSSGVLALVVDWMSLCFDWRALLLTPYNMAFGLTTAFFPSHVTVLANRTFEEFYGGGGTGAAAAASMYTISGLTSAVVAGGAAVAASCGYTRARAASMLLGSAGFTVGSIVPVLASADADGNGLSTQSICAMFVCYGLGVAAWQGSCMAVVGDIFRDRPFAAFAHLKLTSGIVTFLGFFLLPHLDLRSAALATCGVNALGALCFILLCLLMRSSVVPTSTVRAHRVIKVANTPLSVISSTNKTAQDFELQFQAVHISDG